MNSVNGNPYSAPESDVSTVELATGIDNFDRFSAWAVFGLSVITFGIYPIYWMYTRSQTLNSFHDKKISPLLLTTFLLLVITSFITGLFPQTEGVVLMLAGIVNLLYLVVYLVVLFGLRNRLNEIVMDEISPVITFFGSAIYLQYAINKCIDQQASQIA